MIPTQLRPLARETFQVEHHLHRTVVDRIQVHQLVGGVLVAGTQPSQAAYVTHQMPHGCVRITSSAVRAPVLAISGCTVTRKRCVASEYCIESALPCIARTIGCLAAYPVSCTASSCGANVIIAWASVEFVAPGNRSLASGTILSVSPSTPMPSLPIGITTSYAHPSRKTIAKEPPAGIRLPVCRTQSHTYAGPRMSSWRSETLTCFCDSVRG